MWSEIRADCGSIYSPVTLLKNDSELRKVARRRPVGNHVGEWRASPTERKYLATTPNSPISIHKLRYFRPISPTKQPPPLQEEEGNSRRSQRLSAPIYWKLNARIAEKQLLCGRSSFTFITKKPIIFHPGLIWAKITELDSKSNSCWLNLVTCKKQQKNKTN